MKQLQSQSAVPDEVTPSGKAGIVLNPQATESELKSLIKDALFENFKLTDDSASSSSGRASARAAARSSSSVRPLPPSLVSLSALVNLMEAREARKRQREDEPDELPAQLRSELVGNSGQSADTLKARFQGLFLWPFLLGRMPMTSEPRPAEGQSPPPEASTPTTTTTSQARPRRTRSRQASTVPSTPRESRVELVIPDGGDADADDDPVE